jgi:type IV pilus assembly protein PilY1
MTVHQKRGKTAIALVACLSLLFRAGLSLAVDTDIYQASVKQNAYVLLDNSTSMDFGVYESNIDYGGMFDYLFVKDEITDTIVTSDPDYFFENHEPKNRIYLLKGNIGVRVSTIDGEVRAYTGDAADPNYLWYVNDLVDLNTTIDADGNLSGVDGSTQRLTVDGEGHVLLDGVRLPLGQDRKLHDYNTLYDGSVIDEGVGGLLNAPGYYFSGLEGAGSGSGDHDTAEDGDVNIYFLITGNWINMQQMYNLHYVADTDKPAWKYEEFPVGISSGSVVPTTIAYPESGNYTNSLSEADTQRSIVNASAVQIQVHFSSFDVQGNGNVSTFNRDYVALRDAEGNLIAQYDNDNNPAGTWSPVIDGDTVRIHLKSNNSTVGSGYVIDKYRVLYSNDAYLMQNRLDISKEAMVAVVDEFRGKINWGYATFHYVGNPGSDPWDNAEGATIHSALNPNLNDDDNRAAIVGHINNTEPDYSGSPLGEALQDVFDDGYYGHRNSLDNLTCRRSYAIVVSDGYASGDEEWDRIGGVTIGDEDSDGFTADPYQYIPDPAPENYYDDVAHWLYTHSWIDKTEVLDPANSFENVISHQVAFGTFQPLMKDAAEEAGGVYITAYNKAQLINAFYSVALMISEAISFTAPVVSVDAANKVQNGDDLYMGQFLPMDSTYWPGNLKKFKLGDGSVERPDIWTIYDASNMEATDSSGLFLDNTDGFWGDESDSTDFDNFGAPDIHEDGVGEVLTERVAAATSGSYYGRNIKTYLSSTLTDFTQSLDPTVFGLDAANTATRDKIVNWVYGYTFDADAATGDPVAARDWALGAIVHSRPTVIDYYNTSDFSVINKRYIVAGADDGMLHVFDDTNGAEVFAFVPPDVLSKLRKFDPDALDSVLHQPLVDGSIKLFREDGNPKYLILGLRRGGAGYWALDVSDSNVANWTVKWSFSDSEMVQSWSDVSIAKIRTGNNAFTDVAIFSGGYDPVEDNFPEPFDDLDDNGTPYRDTGTLDTSEWRSSDSAQDVYDNNAYDRMNPAGDEHGRAIYVVNLETGALLFSVKNYNHNLDGEGNPQNLPTTKGSASSATEQFRDDFKYCFPASPAVVSFSQLYSYTSESVTVTARKSNVLSVIYAPDIYGNMFRITYDYNGGTPLWQVGHLFSANPGSSKGSGLQTLPTGFDSSDTGRKVFYGPAVSWRGAGRYFDPSNYYHTDATFSGTGNIASLFFGTGDREHPTYRMVKDRVYAIYDDLPVSASNDVEVNSAPYTEQNLLNLTCDDLGAYTGRAEMTQAQIDTYKTSLRTLLTDDVLNTTLSDSMEKADDGNGENDAKGWYIILEKQGLSSYCPNCVYETTIASSEGGRDDHVGEKVLGEMALFAGNLYFTTYQPSNDDPCSPQGNAFNYALSYLDGSAALNLNTANDEVVDGIRIKTRDITDRYRKHSAVKGLPSGFEIVVRGGKAGAMASIGGRIIGGGEVPNDDDDDDDDDECKTDKCIYNYENGISLYYWIER